MCHRKKFIFWYSNLIQSWILSIYKSPLIFKDPTWSFYSFLYKLFYYMLRIPTIRFIWNTSTISVITTYSLKFLVIQVIHFWRYRVIIIVYFWYAFLIAYHPYPIKIHAWTFSIYEHLKKYIHWIENIVHWSHIILYPFYY